MLPAGGWLLPEAGGAGFAGVWVPPVAGPVPLPAGGDAGDDAGGVLVPGNVTVTAAWPLAPYRPSSPATPLASRDRAPRRPRVSDGPVGVRGARC